MTREALRERLLSLQDTGYQAFQHRLIPNAGSLIGVRMPALRRIASELIEQDWRAWLDGIHTDDWHEESILCALVIAQAPMPLAERLQRLRAFVPRIQNWAVCDCLCSALRIGEREVLWDFLQPDLYSTEEFPARFGAVMLLQNFVTADDLPYTLSALAQIPARGYHARMGVAWAYSVCCVAFPQETLAFLETAGLDDWTHNKALQKMLESRRLPQTLRETVQMHKRKGRGGKPQ